MNKFRLRAYAKACNLTVKKLKNGKYELSYDSYILVSNTNKNLTKWCVELYSGVHEQHQYLLTKLEGK